MKSRNAFILKGLRDFYNKRKKEKLGNIQPFTEFIGGRERARTSDLYHVKVAL